MPFRTAAELADTCDYDTSPPSGYGADCRFIGFGEEGTTEVANRAHYALAENDDYLKAAINRSIAVLEVLGVTGPGTNTITLTVGGGGANPSAAVFVGDGTYSNTQEYRNILVSLLDANYEEMQDGSGNEIVCTAIQRADTHANIIGLGFWDTTAIELIFSAVIPVVSCRLHVSVETDIENIKPDALILTSIRAAQEVDASVDKRLDDIEGDIVTIDGRLDGHDTDIAELQTVITCAISGDADYVGVDAIENAIAAISGNSVLFVRAGTYVLPSSITKDHITIIGEGRDGVNLNFTADAFTDSGDYNQYKNVTFSGVADPTNVSFTGTNTRFVNCDFWACGLVLTIDRAKFESCRIRDNLAVNAVTLNTGAKYITFDNCEIRGQSGSDGVTFLNDDPYSIDFINCYITVASGGTALNLGGVEVSFDTCQIENSAGTAEVINGTIANSKAYFNNCLITGPANVLDINATPITISFDCCRIINSAVSTYANYFVRVRAVNGKIMFNNCKFVDDYSTLDPIMEFTDTSLIDCQFIRENVAEFNTNYRWLYLVRTLVKRFLCKSNTAASKAGAGSIDGVFYFDRSEVRDFEFTAPNIITLDCPIFYVKGSLKQRGILDRVYLSTSASAIGAASGVGLFHVVDYGVLSEFILSSSYNIITCGASTDLIHLSGDSSKCENCIIEMDNSSTFRSVFTLSGTNHVVSDNRVILQGTAATNNDYIIYCEDPVSSSYRTEIMRNEFFTDRQPYSPANCPIRIEDAANPPRIRYWRIYDNVISVDTITDTAAERELIYVEVNDLAIGNSGAVAAYGNILSAQDNTDTVELPRINWVNGVPWVNDTNIYVIEA